MEMPKIRASEFFVSVTGLAALIHSTWSLGTLFSGEQPAIESITTAIGYVHFAGWLVPALLIAIALDVGQVVTSHEIRQRGLTISRGLTFFIFAFATYYLQWLYIVHHTPMLPIADGVSDIHKSLTISLRDVGIWLLPALLPLSTLLYTFSGDNALKPKIKQLESKPKPKSDDMPFMPIEENQHIAICEICGWQSEAKESSGKAAQSLAAHQRHCKSEGERV